MTQHNQAFEVTDNYVNCLLRVEAAKPHGYPVQLQYWPEGNEITSTTLGGLTRSDQQIIDNALPHLQAPGIHGQIPRGPVVDRLQELGECLARILLPDELLIALLQELDNAHAHGKKLRLRLLIEPPKLASLPWEYLYISAKRIEQLQKPTAYQDPAEAGSMETLDQHTIQRWIGLASGYLNLNPNISLVRQYTVKPPEKDPLSIEAKLWVLVILSDVVDPNYPTDVSRKPSWSPLNVRKSKELIQDILRGNKRIAVTFLQRATVGRIREALKAAKRMKHPYHLIQYEGHACYYTAKDTDRPPAAPDGASLVLEHPADRSPVYLEADKFVKLLMEHDVRAVMLNACNTAKEESAVFSSLARSLATKGFPAVIASQFEVCDRTAPSFCHAFYESLGALRCLDDCFKDGIDAVAQHPSCNHDWGVYVYCLQSVHSVLFEDDRVRWERRYRRAVAEANWPLQMFGPPMPAPRPLPQVYVPLRLKYTERWREYTVADEVTRRGGGIAAIDSEQRVWAEREMERGTWERDQEREEILEVPEALRRFRPCHLAVVGDPGCGKTTMLRWLAHEFAVGNPEMVSKARENFMPILIRLAEFARSRRELLLYILGLLRGPFQLPKGKRTLDYVESKLQEGKCILLLDALDEIADVERRDQVAKAITNFASNFTRCPIIVTSRLAGFSSIPGFRVLRVMDFDNRQIEEFIKKWFSDGSLSS